MPAEVCHPIKPKTGYVVPAPCKTCGASGSYRYELLKKEANAEGRNIPWSFLDPRIDPKWGAYNREKEAELGTKTSRGGGFTAPSPAPACASAPESPAQAVLVSGIEKR